MQVRVIRTGAASYLALFAILLWQALRGQSLVSPDVTAVAIVITWLTLTGGAVWVAVRQPLPSPAIVIGSGS
jgi:hypothetical protein